MTTADENRTYKILAGIGFIGDDLINGCILGKGITATKEEKC